MMKRDKARSPGEGACRKVRIPSIYPPLGEGLPPYPLRRLPELKAHFSRSLRRREHVRRREGALSRMVVPGPAVLTQLLPLHTRAAGLVEVACTACDLKPRGGRTGFRLNCKRTRASGVDTPWVRASLNFYIYILYVSVDVPGV